MKVIDMTGQRFGKLTVLTRAENSNSGKARWLCRCDCGTETIVSRDNLIHGRHISCGCVRKQQVGRLNLRHGASKTRLYSIYTNMITRTENPRATAFHRYGGRGIKVCAEWRNSFEMFRAWALANGYADNLEIDRIDNDKGYSPENCRWVSHKANGRNRHSGKPICYKGESLLAVEWAERTGIPAKCIRRRLSDGWSVEKALTTPPGGAE